ncbi:hypothetical protein BDN67DRAFT_69950 [Paxillus ammoniavirescens]|nr:hypothetical protein BDN67DRAFT_69950 [Paxillus ammoniavirescens]
MTINCQTRPHRPLHVIFFHHLFTAEVLHHLKRTTQIAPTCRPPSTTDSPELTHAHENRWVVHDSHLRTQVLNGFNKIVPFQPSSIWSSVTPSVTQKHFGDIPDLTEYLQRLHIDPVAAGGYGNVYKCSLRHANDHSSEVAVKSFRHALAQNNTGAPQEEFPKAST